MMSNAQSLASSDGFAISSNDSASSIHTDDELDQISNISSDDGLLSKTLHPFRRTLLRAFKKIKPPEFCTGGLLPFITPPDLNIANIGEISLPLNPSQAAQLRADSHQAPFGRGTQTLVDRSVRNCRQIEPSRIALSPNWNKSIQKLLAIKVANTLGISNHVRASLYKLVLYEDGGFFKAHKDTEKEPGMFASLIVQLPAWQALFSGALIVHHHGEEKRFDFSRHSGSESFYSAFYADCEKVTEIVDCCLFVEKQDCSHILAQTFWQEC